MQSSSKAAVETYAPGGKIEIKGVEYTLEDDEVELPDDEKGETKVDKNGRLLGGMSGPLMRLWMYRN